MVTVILGNAPIAADLRAAVQNADKVVRMNTCESFDGLTGDRIDVLAITTTGTPPLMFLTERPGNFGRGFDQAGTILLARNARHSALRRWRTAENPEHFVDHGGTVRRAAAAAGKVVIRPTLWETLALERKLKSLGAPSESMPSTGLCVVDYYLRRLPKGQFILAGFAHSGWYRHPWEAERQYFESLRHRPNISIFY